MTDDDKTMLALAALTYRGFGHHREASIARRLQSWLPALDAAGLGRWQLAWGPASFRAPTSLVDDAMAYVAKRLDGGPGTPPRYVLAIRGTNPVSLFDWTFGDMWVRHQVDWPSTAGARLSASTALGLAILRNLTADDRPPIGGSLAALANALTSSVQSVVRELPELLPEQILADPGVLPDAVLLERIDLLSGTSGERLRLGLFDRLGEHLEDATEPVQSLVHERVYDLLLEQIARSRGPGTTIEEFLERTVERGAEVTVIGHSKGGALALAMALWLAEGWAGGGRADVRCFTFAGPTAGNAAFAARYDAVLGARTRCIVNRRDIVPQAWAVDDLARVGATYPLLDIPTDALSRSVDRLGYTHVAGTQVAFTPSGTARALGEELIYQHLDAYLKEAGLTGPRWNALSIFLERG